MNPSGPCRDCVVQARYAGTVSMRSAPTKSRHLRPIHRLRCAQVLFEEAAVGAHEGFDLTDELHDGDSQDSVRRPGDLPFRRRRRSSAVRNGLQVAHAPASTLWTLPCSLHAPVVLAASIPEKCTAHRSQLSRRMTRARRRAATRYAGSRGSARSESSWTRSHSQTGVNLSNSGRADDSRARSYAHARPTPWAG